MNMTRCVKYQISSSINCFLWYIFSVIIVTNYIFCLVIFIFTTPKTCNHIVYYGSSCYTQSFVSAYIHTTRSKTIFLFWTQKAPFSRSNSPGDTIALQWYALIPRKQEVSVDEVCGRYSTTRYGTHSYLKLKSERNVQLEFLRQ